MQRNGKAGNGCALNGNGEAKNGLAWRRTAKGRQGMEENSIEVQEMIC
nr:MAG TPA: hypothetical protein [Caudoviricetes sp.]